MTNRQILKGVFEKAIDNGWTVNQASFDYLMNLLRTNDKTCQIALDYCIDEKKYYDTIFSHEFVKAFWGEKDYKMLGASIDLGCNAPHGISNAEIKKMYGKEALEKLKNANGRWITCDSISKEAYTDCASMRAELAIINKGWKYYLQKMVLEKEPLKYLEKFL